MMQIGIASVHGLALGGKVRGFQEKVRGFQEKVRGFQEKVHKKNIIPLRST